MNLDKLQKVLACEMEADAHWESMSDSERASYRMAVGDASGKSWWDSLTNPQRTEYVKEHPASKFAQHLKTLPLHIKHKFNRLSDNSKKAVADWHEKTPEEKMHSVGQGLVHAAKHIGQHAVNHVKHEVHTYKGAGEAIKHLGSGKKWKDLHPHHKKALKTALLHAGLTAGSMALGDASGSIGHIAGAFAAEHAHHAALLGAGDVALKTGKHALKKATAAEVDKNKIKQEAQRIARLLIDAEIPTSEWIDIIHELERQAKLKAQ